MGAHGLGGDALAAAAGRAPSLPGVYLFLDGDDTLLYVGKAGNLRQRLAQHAAAGRPTSHLHGRYDLVRSVRWQLTPTEDEAAWLESDLIFALAPPFNSETGRRRPYETRRPPGAFILVSEAGAGDLVFDMLPARDAAPATGIAGRARMYGFFPHLGKGVASRIGVACSDGYVALLRLLWAASPAPEPVPRVITRSAPPRFRVSVDAGFGPRLHRLLSGTGARGLDALLQSALARRPVYMRPALERDRCSAGAFFAAGPSRLRSLRLRHGMAPGPLAPGDIRTLLQAEIRSAVGSFGHG